MLISPKTAPLTPTRLLGRRWAWGPLHQEPITTALEFGADGFIKGYQHENEHSWKLQDGMLQIFSKAGALFWQFEIVFEAEGRLTMISRFQNNAPWQPFFCLVEQAAVAPAAEAVRLVIWDLDDTFWQGTLSEGPVTPVLEHIACVRELSARGIINSICSKNHFDEAKVILQNLGVWEDFVFPEIAFAPKGPAVARIVENMQLRPESVLFIDDNVTNLNEALYYSPKLQIAEPTLIAGLLADPRLKGKPDPQGTRLKHYKVLEQKAAEKQAANGDNKKFLRDSQIRVSFHTDIESEFPRIHDLVNRTNQLNFTKNRWPEDIEAARAAYHREQKRDFTSYGGYVKVADKYGSYGICGFYFVILDVCEHFLFSCRSMNMGVEQFVWNRLKRPRVDIKGEVISDLDMDVDWITVVRDADAAEPVPVAGQKLNICIRGACDMSMTSNFLRTRADTIEELTFAWEGWEICSLPRIVALHEELKNPANQAIIRQLPGMPPGRFNSSIITGAADAYVLSFSQESFHGLYRARSTGMILPMGHFSMGPAWGPKRDYTQVPYADIERQSILGISQAEWEFFRSEFEFLGGFNAQLFAQDIDVVFRMLAAHSKPVVIIGLNDSVGTDQPILAFFGEVNNIVRPAAEAYGMHYLDMKNFVRTHDDLAPDGIFGGPHFARRIYADLADAILDCLDGGLRAVA